MEMTKILIDRLTAAKDKLVAKGYECPNCEVGIKVLGKHGAVFWAHLYLSDPKNWVSEWTHKSVEDALDAIDRATESVPIKGDREKEIRSAVAKLTPKERELLGIE